MLDGLSEVDSNKVLERGGIPIGSSAGKLPQLHAILRSVQTGALELSFSPMAQSEQGSLFLGFFLRPTEVHSVL